MEFLGIAWLRYEHGRQKRAWASQSEQNASQRRNACGALNARAAHDRGHFIGPFEAETSRPLVEWFGICCE
jgi:hypothetical protein